MRETTLGRELKALNGKEMTLGYKWEKMTMGRELKALNGKEMTLGHKWEKWLNVMIFQLSMEKKLL